MKKMFFIAIGVVIVFLCLLVGYGAFLNYKSEKVIDIQMANRILKLEGAKVRQRMLLPVWERESLRLSAEKMTDAISRLEGTVEEVFVAVNDSVIKGQPICRITNEDIPIKLAQIDVSIAKAEASLVRYEHSYERYNSLLSYGAVSKEQYDEALANYKAAQSEVEQLKLERRQYEIQQDRLIVTAPLSGEVLMLYKKPGSFLPAGASVALIGDFSTLQFTDVVTDEDMERLGPIDIPGELQFSENDMEKIYATGYKAGNMGQNQTFKVWVTSVDPPESVPAAMRRVSWSIDNSSGLLEPKRYQNVKIRAIRERRGLTIPKTALLDGDRVYVWKQSDGALELRQIQTGGTDGKYVEVMDGLQEGEVVIVSGKEGLSVGLKVEVDIREETNDEE